MGDQTVDQGPQVGWTADVWREGREGTGPHFWHQAEIVGGVQGFHAFPGRAEAEPLLGFVVSPLPSIVFRVRATVAIDCGNRLEVSTLELANMICTD